MALVPVPVPVHSWHMGPVPVPTTAVDRVPGRDEVSEVLCPNWVCRAMCAVCVHVTRSKQFSIGLLPLQRIRIPVSCILIFFGPAGAAGGARQIAETLMDFVGSTSQGSSHTFFIINTQDCRHDGAHWILVAIFMRWQC